MNWHCRKHSSEFLGRTFCALSKACPPLIRTPREAPTPVPTITAVGVARPRAHGQAITITDIPN